MAADEKLVADFAGRLLQEGYAVWHEYPDSHDEPDLDAARNLLTWLAERGRPTPDAAETTEQWGVRLTRNIDGETEDRPLASREDAEEFIAAANAANAAAPAERAAWEWTPGLIRQQVITTPWEPVAEETNGQGRPTWLFDLDNLTAAKETKRQ